METAHFVNLIALGTGAPLDYSQNETFIDAFLRQVEKTPEATAVVDEYGSITYRELNGRSDFVAAELLEKGVKAGDYVAIKLPRVKEFIVAVLGTWKAGAGADVAEYATFSFVQSCNDLYPPLTAGAAVHIISASMQE